MKRDMDTIRDLLIAIEEAEKPTSSYSLVEDRGDDETKKIIAHLRLLHDAKYLKGIVSNPISGRWNIQNLELTWEGHDFIEAIRDPEVWRRTKEGAMTMGSWSVDLLKDMGKAYLKHVAKERLGLDL